MRVLSMGRCEGKTRTLEVMSLVYGTPIIVATESERVGIHDEFPEVIVFTAREVANGRMRGMSFEEVLVDDIDRVLFELLGQKVLMGTITER